MISTTDLCLMSLLNGGCSISIFFMLGFLAVNAALNEHVGQIHVFALKLIGKFETVNKFQDLYYDVLGLFLFIYL